MQKYIVDNAHWIFDGIGVLAIGGIISWIFNLLTTRKTKDQSRDVRSQAISAGPSSTNIQTGDASTVHVTTNHQETGTMQHNPIKIDQDCAVKQKVIILEGDYQEFIWGQRTIRISVFETVKGEFQFSRFVKKEGMGAVVDFDMGGSIVYGGEYCKEVAVNKFLIPQKESSDEEPSSVFAYHIFDKADYKSFSFMRVFVDHINPHSHRVTLDLFFAAGPIKA